ncbi:MAG: hypothetical protein F6J97_22425 [Leptolyngbya sp. SIO4C1]|nr:hypothetical protein [Leptolyngbya sp. SIO4C1]
MSYQLVAAINTPPPEDEVLLPGVYQAETEFIIEVLSPEGERRGWQRAGYLARMFDIPGVGLTEGEVYKLYLERKKLKYARSAEPFRLEFRPVYWIIDYQLRLWVKAAEPIPSIQLTINGEVFTFNGEGITFP